MDATIRIHYKGDRADPHFIKCVDFIKTLGSYYIAHETKANRNHIQAYVWMTKYKSLAVLRDRIVKTLDVHGQEEYSVSKLRRTRLRYLAYLMKEGPSAFVASCSLETDVAEATLLREAFIEEEKKTPSQRGYTVYQKMVDDIGNEHLVEPREIGKEMLMWFYKQGKLIPDTNMLKRYVNTYRFGKDPDKGTERILDSVYDWN